MKASLLIQNFHDFFWAGPCPSNGIATSLFISSKTHTVLRYIFAVYTTILLLSESFEDSWSTITNLQYLTFWGVYLNLFYFWFTARNMHWKTTHLLFEIAFSVQISIVLVYWLAVFPTINRKDTLLWWWQTVSEHGVMLLFLWIDNFFNSIRFYKRHVILLGLFMFTYLLLNGLITLCYKPVYTPIDWISVTSYAYSALAIKLGILHFFIGVFFFDVFKRERIEKDKNSYYLRNEGKVVAVARKISDEISATSSITQIKDNVSQSTQFQLSTNSLQTDGEIQQLHSNTILLTQGSDKKSYLDEI